ncbi:hypothetical protein [Streptomyces sp. NPDC058326]|uniref:hypothetical protein n=1 Tax=Streptomyces sp. NPDC058326 TaxID=3346447 RepID=UPI0036E96CAA
MNRTTGAPATPAGARTRPARGGGYPWIVLFLVLLALVGTGTAGVLPGGAEFRTAAAAPAPDPHGETHDPAAAEAGPPRRARRHRTGIRPAPARRHPRTGRRRPSRTAAPAPVPAPRGDALRRVVMRC